MICVQCTFCLHSGGVPCSGKHPLGIVSVCIAISCATDQRVKAAYMNCAAISLLTVHHLLAHMNRSSPFTGAHESQFGSCTRPCSLCSLCQCMCLEPGAVKLHRCHSRSASIWPPRPTHHTKYVCAKYISSQTSGHWCRFCSIGLATCGPGSASKGNYALEVPALIQ